MEDVYTNLLGAYGPFAVFLLLLLTGVGVPLGEDLVIIPAGILVGYGTLNPWLTALWAYAGVLTSDCMWYALCSEYGTRLLHKRWFKRTIHPRRLLEVKHHIEERGAWVVLMARFIPGSRTPAITSAGLMHLPFWKFVVATATGCLATVPLQLGLGFLIARGIGTMETADLVQAIIGVVILILAILLVLAWWRQHRARRQNRPRAKARVAPPFSPPGLAARKAAMRALVTGQVGMDKKPYLEAAAELARSRGRRVETFHIGDLMYAEARDIRPGRILDLPLSRLNALRRAVFRDIIAETSPPPDHPDVIVNTHATFRWRHGLFPAFDFDQIRNLAPNMFICLVDNIEMVHHRLHADHDIDANLKDCMVWREEEILATELIAKAMEAESRFFIVSRGRHRDTTEPFLRLITRPDMKKVYPSFPMTHVADMPDVLAEIDHFRAELAKRFITFDPGEVDEKLLLERALAAAANGEDWVPTTAHPFGAPESSPPLRVSVREVLDIAGDIDGQIYMRDFKLIDQSDMICSYIPELPGGMPGLSSGVERELHHAFEHTKEVYVVWKPRKTASPFITETATKIFPTVDDALAHFEAEGMFAEEDLFGN